MNIIQVLAVLFLLVALWWLYRVLAEDYSKEVKVRRARLYIQNIIKKQHSGKPLTSVEQELFNELHRLRILRPEWIMGVHEDNFYGTAIARNPTEQEATEIIQKLSNQ